MSSFSRSDARTSSEQAVILNEFRVGGLDTLKLLLDPFAMEMKLIFAGAHNGRRGCLELETGIGWGGGGGGVA